MNTSPGLLIIIITMGVSLQIYRHAIGRFNVNSNFRKSELSTCEASHDEPSGTQSGLSLYILFYIIIIFFMFIYMISVIMQSRNNSTSFGRVKNQLFSSTPYSLYHTPLFLKHINTLYLMSRNYK